MAHCNYIKLLFTGLIQYDSRYLRSNGKDYAINSY